MAFGVWDIFSYVFLNIMCDWPKSVFDWDILFLLPLPWWGPVLAPASIALLMIVAGTLVTQRRASPATAVTSALWRSNLAGVALALYVFMEDSLRALPQGLMRRGPCCRRHSICPCSSWHCPMAAPVAQEAWSFVCSRRIARQGRSYRAPRRERSSEVRRDGRDRAHVRLRFARNSPSSVQVCLSG